MTSRVVSVHQPEFLPWLGFWDKFRQSDVFVLLDNVQFEKNYFQNRNRIRTPVPEGWSWLTVPVLGKGRSEQEIREVEINTSVDWRRKLLGALEQNYRNAPAFPRLWPALKGMIEGAPPLLADFTVSIIGWMARELGLAKETVRASSLGAKGSRTELLVGICRELGATEYLSGISGKEYLDEALFREAGIPVRYQEFYHPIYPQVYEPFVPAMAGVDLLFNCGEGSLPLLADEKTPRLTSLFH